MGQSLSAGLRETLSVFDPAGEPRTTPEVADALGLERRTAYARLERLVEADRLATKKVGANARVWWRPAGAAAHSPDWPAAAESLIDDALDDVEVGVFVLDDEFNVAWINEATERYFQLDRSEVLGQDKRQLVDEHIASLVENAEAFTETVLATYDENTYTERFDCHVASSEDGEGRWLEHRSKPIESGAYAGGRVELYYDITDRKRSEQAWQEERQQFTSLVKAVDEYAIFTLDVDGHVRTWNPGAERIKGYADEDIVGEHFSTFYTESDRADDVPERNLRAAAELGSVQDEGWRVRADGSRFWANVTITAIREDGDLVGFAKVTRDMTERRAQKQRLREEISFVESLLDTQPDLLYAFDRDLEPLRWNDRFEAVTGYTADEIAEMDPVDFLADEAAERTTAAIERIFEHGERITIEAPLVTADGEEIPYEFTGGPLTDDEGEIIGYTGVGRDVSERKARERRLERQHHELQAELEDIFTRIGEAFFALDDDWRITYVNDRAADMVGLSTGELLQTHVWDASPEVSEGRPRELAERAMETQTPVEFEFHSEILDSWLEIRAYPAEEGLSVYVRDISGRKAREHELELYETIVDTVEDGIYVLDDDFCFVEVNDAYVELTGYDREELLGSHSSLIASDDAVAEAAGLTRELAEGDGGSELLEADLHRADGSTLRVENRFSAVPTEDGTVQNVGVVRDVSERVEREQELRDRVRQQQVVADLGQRALQVSDLDALLAEATAVVAETLDTDYCKVLDLQADAEDLLLRQGVGWDDGVVGDATVSAVEDDSQAAYTLATEHPVLVEDIETDSRFGGPELLTSHDVSSGISTIIGPTDDPWGILGAHDTDRREFSEQDATFVQSVANVLAAAIERHGYEQELVYQREQLAALNSLNEVVRDISSAVIEQSTREEIEQTVCERLAESESYKFAWIAEVDPRTMELDPHVEAGVDGYLDDVPISMDPDEPSGQGPAGRAIRSLEIQTTSDAMTDVDFEPWREHAKEYGYRSTAAVPIIHEGTLYGLLGIYADRPNAFEGQEKDVISQLGEVVGHAIAATERKRALMSDELVELEFQIKDVFEALDVATETDDPITLDNAVPVADGEFIVYGTASPSAMDTVRVLADELPHWESLTVRGDGDPATFEVRMSDPPVLSVVASLGGYVDSAVVDGGDFRLSVHLAPTVDARQVIDAMEAAYPSAEMLRRRQITRTQDDPQPLPAQLLGDLTDRQRAAVEAAYHAGFFEWPRDASGEEVAASLDVSPPTFHQHLRKAERKLFESLFTSPVGEPEAATSDAS